MNPLCVRKTFFVPELQSYLRTCTYVYPADPRSRIQSQIHVKVKNNRHGISQELWGVSSVHSRSIRHIHHMSSKLSSGGNKACPSLRSIALVEARQQLALSIWKLIESFGAKFIPLLKKRKGASILHRSTGTCESKYVLVYVHLEVSWTLSAKYISDVTVWNIVNPRCGFAQITIDHSL